MPTVPFMIFLVSMLLAGHVCGQEAGPGTLKTDASQPSLAILYSPDQQYYVAWTDADLGAPLGEIRPVVFRFKSDPEDIFSFVTHPGHTQAAWNPVSTRCVIGDQPNNGEVYVWLVYEEQPKKWLWRKIDALAPVYAAYRHALGERDTPLFRPYLDKIEWLSDTQVRFLIECNLGGHETAAAGRYFVTFDFQKPDVAPDMTKIADQPQVSASTSSTEFPLGYVLVTGDFPRSGRIAYKEGMKASDALEVTWFEGATKTLSRARFIRNGKIELINVGLIRTGRSEDFPLQPGDWISFPTSSFQK